MNELHNITDIKAIFKDQSPKFVSLKNANGEFIIHWNQPKHPAADRFKEIIAFLEKKSVPAGIYFFCTRTSVMKSAQELRYPISIKGAKLSEGSADPVPAVTQSVWSFNQALDIISERNRLQMLCDLKDKEISELQRQVSELMTEIDELEKQPPALSEKQSDAASWIKDLKETIAPLADVYFEQRDRQLTIEERKAGIDRSAKLRKVIRNDGGLLPSDPGYQKYFEAILASGNDDHINQELDFVEKSFPEVYKRICQVYNINDDDADQDDQDHNDNAKAM